MYWKGATPPSSKLFKADLADFVSFNAIDCCQHLLTVFLHKIGHLRTTWYYVSLPEHFFLFTF